MVYTNRIETIDERREMRTILDQQQNRQAKVFNFVAFIKTSSADIKKKALSIFQKPSQVWELLAVISLPRLSRVFPVAATGLQGAPVMNRDIFKQSRAPLPVRFGCVPTKNSLDSWSELLGVSLLWVRE